MRTLPILLLCIFFFACTQSEDERLQQRWNFSGTDIKQLKDAADAFGSAYDVDGFRQLFAGSKFIIRKDGTFDLNIFQNYRHGKWEKHDNKLILKPEPSNIPVTVNIDTLSIEWMKISIDTNEFNKLGRFVMPQPFGKLEKRRQSSRFKLQLDNEKYSNVTNDPYSRDNNWWRIKPLKPETDEEINKRLLNLVDFHLRMFEDAKERNKTSIIYSWFSSPLIVANNGLGLQHYSKIEATWNECFYDSAQAHQAYQILQKPFDKQLRLPQDEKDPFERSIKMLRLYRKHVQ